KLNLSLQIFNLPAAIIKPILIQRHLHLEFLTPFMSTMGNSGSNKSELRLGSSWNDMDHEAAVFDEGHGDPSSFNGLLKFGNSGIIPEEIMEVLLSYVDVRDILAVSQV